MLTKKLMLGALTLGLTVVGSAQADIFAFDPTGTGSTAINTAAVLDPLPGNSLAINGAQTLTVGSTTTNLFQANLGTVIDGSPTPTVLYTNGDLGHFFTFVAGFGESVTSCSGALLGGCSAASFAVNASQPNFAYMYANTTAPGNNLTGTGFTAGTAILSGEVVSGTSNFTVTAVPGANETPNCPQTNLALPSTCLDQFGTNNYPGVQTVSGVGSADIVIRISSVDSLYFPTLHTGDLITLALNTSLVDPFKQVDPSAAFSSNGTTSANTPNNIGTINGVTGPNFQFQSDANISLTTRPVTVPEPGSLALLGLALGTMALLSSKRRKS